MKRLNRIFDADIAYDIYPYEASIYELYDELTADPDLDFLLFLRSKTTDESKRRMLEKPFSSKYLIFDFDPHYHKHESGKVAAMMTFFNDSRENGKLYVNYPMIESFRHLKRMPDREFRDRTVDSTELAQYKRIVGDDSAYTETNKYTYPVAMNMICHHLAKVHALVLGTYSILDLDHFIKDGPLTLLRLNDIQESRYEKDRIVPVVCTAAFFVIDLRPKSFFEQALKIVAL